MQISDSNVLAVLFTSLAYGFEPKSSCVLEHFSSATKRSVCCNYGAPTQHGHVSEVDQRFYATLRPPLPSSRTLVLAPRMSPQIRFFSSSYSYELLHPPLSRTRGSNTIYVTCRIVTCARNKGCCVNLRRVPYLLPQC